MDKDNNAVELLKLQTEIERLKGRLAVRNYNVRELISKVRELTLANAELEVEILDIRYLEYTGEKALSNFVPALELYGRAMTVGNSEDAIVYYDKLVELYNNSQNERDYHKAEARKQLMLCWLERYKLEHDLDNENEDV